MVMVIVGCTACCGVTLLPFLPFLPGAARPPQVRKSYKRLALQLHPDKSASACRVTARCCGSGSAAYEAAGAAERLRDRATWLFKLLGAWLYCTPICSVCVQGTKLCLKPPLPLLMTR